MTLNSTCFNLSSVVIKIAGMTVSGVDSALEIEIPRRPILIHYAHDDKDRAVMELHNGLRGRFPFARVASVNGATCILGRDVEIQRDPDAIIRREVIGSGGTLWIYDNVYVKNDGVFGSFEGDYKMTMKQAAAPVSGFDTLSSRVSRFHPEYDRGIQLDDDIVGMFKNFAMLAG